jgi:hypothetical protein
LIASAAICPSPAHAAGIVQIGLVLDNTGSIAAPNWAIIVTGVATALTNNIPHDGTVELTVVDFSDGLSEVHGTFTYYAKTEVAPTLITAINFAAVASTISLIPYTGGSTSMADGVYVAWLDMAASPNFQASGRQIINLATDGVPNVRWSCTTCTGYAGGDDHSDVTAARNLAVTGGLDELDSEGIGTGVDMNYLRDSVVWPQPGTIAPPYTAGWVEQVADATAFAAALANKFQVIIQTSTTAVPPAAPIPEYPLGLPLLAIFMLVAYGIIRRKTTMSKQ